MKPAVVLVLVLALAGCPAARTPAAPEHAEAAPLARLVVRVVDSDGAPVAGASVWLPGAIAPLVTGADGRTTQVELLPLPGSSVEVKAEALASRHVPVTLVPGPQELQVVLAPIGPEAQTPAP